MPKRNLRGSGRICKQELVPSQSDRGSGRASKQESVLPQPDQRCEEGRNLCNDGPGVHSPANQLVNSRQSSHQTHRNGRNESRVDTDAVPVEVTPDDCTALKEQSNSQKNQVSGEQSYPTKANNTSSQMTQEGQDSVEKAKRKGKSRRRRSRKRKLEKAIRERQAAENPPSDFTGEGPADSRQTTESTTYYGIRNGNYGYNGVHTDWDLCVRYMKGTCGATFKSFRTLEQAFEFAHGGRSPGESAPLKKMKTEVKPPSTNTETDAPPSPENESQSLEEVEPPVDLRRPDQGRSPNGKATPNGRSQGPARSRLRNRPARKGRPKKKPKASGEDPSLEEILPPKGIQLTEEVPTPEVVEPAHEIRLQEWKVEPVLLPSDLFSPDDNPVKREQTLIPIEPSSAGHWNDSRFGHR